MTSGVWMLDLACCVPGGGDCGAIDHPIAAEQVASRPPGWSGVKTQGNFRNISDRIFEFRGM